MKKQILSIGLVGLLFVGSVYAYFTNNEVTKMDLITGNITVDLCENYRPVEGWITAGSEIYISPCAFSTGVNDAIVFMEVVVPAIDAEYVADGHHYSTGLTDVFGFTSGGGDFCYGEDLGSSNWIFMETRYYSYRGVESFGYIYGYNKKLSQWDVSDPLFTSLKIVSLTNVTDGIYLEVPVRIYAIQADSVFGSNIVVPEGSTDTSTRITVDVNNLTGSSLKYILNTYTNQNHYRVENGYFEDADTSGRFDIRWNSIS